MLFQRVLMVFFACTLSWSVEAANRSPDLRQTLNRAAPDLSRLKAFHVILVPGFLNRKEINLLNWDLFRPQMDVLKKAGISFERFDYDENRIAINARLLSERINSSSKPVILVAHSLGAQVALEALLVNGEFDNPRAFTHKDLAAEKLMGLCQKVLHHTAVLRLPTLGVLLDPERRSCRFPLQARTEAIRPKVAALLTLNGNIAGTPLLDWAFDDRFSVADALLQSYLKFRPKSLTINMFEMTQSVASARLRDNERELARVLHQIPVLSVASTYIPHPSGPGSGDDQVDRLGQILKENGVSASDGVVPTKNAILPGADYILLKQVSHFELVKDYPHARVDARRISRALFSLLADRLR